MGAASQLQGSGKSTDSSDLKRCCDCDAYRSQFRLVFIQHYPVSRLKRVTRRFDQRQLLLESRRHSSIDSAWAASNSTKGGIWVGVFSRRCLGQESVVWSRYRGVLSRRLGQSLVAQGRDATVRRVYQTKMKWCKASDSEGSSFSAIRSRSQTENTRLKRASSWASAHRLHSGLRPSAYNQRSLCDHQHLILWLS